MKANVRDGFDAAYYRRFYGSRAGVPDDLRRLVDFVTAYMRHLRIPLRSVLDVGCGRGRWRGALAERGAGVRYVGIDPSADACRRYGWTRGNAASFDMKRRFDLVVCHSVLQYLPDRDVARALENLARHTRGALYLEVLTTEDRENDAYDPRGTDEAVFFRRADWYRRRLSRHFQACGGGLYIPHSSRAVLLALEEGR